MAEDIIINGTVYQDVPAINIPKNVGYGGGTEEYVDYKVSQGTRDVSIPAGHNSKYYTNWTGEEYYEDKVPYSFRQTPGSGKRLAEEVVGATVGWNQLAPDNLTSSTAPESIAFNSGTQIITGHKYLTNITRDDNQSRLVMSVTARTGGAFVTCFTMIDAPAGGSLRNTTILASIGGGTSNGTAGASEGNVFIYRNNYTPADTVTNVQIIDLTLALGSTIADYLYTLESNTPGAGVAKFRELFPKDYYAYCEPTLQSVCVSKHIEANSDSTEINEYPLEAVELRGVLKLDGNNNIYADGDIYKGSGEVERIMGVIDLGTIDWDYSLTYNWFAPVIASPFRSLIKPVANNSDYANIRMADYITSTRTAMGNDLTVDKVIGVNNMGGFIIRNLAYTDAATFKAAMSGVYLVYELATPTTESADPFTNPQYTSGGGLVRYVYSNPAEGQEF